jgi:hypothetical protein
VASLSHQGHCQWAMDTGSTPYLNPPATVLLLKVLGGRAEARGGAAAAHAIPGEQQRRVGAYEERLSSKTRSPNVSEVSPVGMLSASYSRRLTLLDSLEEAAAHEAGRRVGRALDSAGYGRCAEQRARRGRCSEAEQQQQGGAQGGAARGADGRVLVTMREKELRKVTE